MSKRQITFFIMMLLLVNGMEAQDLTKTDSIAYNRALDEVVVSASRAEEKTPVTYSTINAEELRKANTGVDLPYLLKNTPSLVVTSDAGTGIGYTGLHIRGSDLTRINVTLNGVPVNGGEDFTVYFVDLPDLASSVDNIQVQRGVGTSTNGSAAFGASINIKTEAESPVPFATLSSSAGSFMSFKNTLSFGTGRIKPGFNFSGRLSKIISDGFVDRGWSNLGSMYLCGSWSNQKNMLKVIYMGGKERTYQAWYGIPKSMVDTNPTYNPAGEMYDLEGHLIGFYDNQTDNFTQNYYQVHYAHNFTENLTLTSSIFRTTGKGYFENYMNNPLIANYLIPSFYIGDSLVDHANVIEQKWVENTFTGFNLAVNYKVWRFNNTFGHGESHFVGNHYGLAHLADFEDPVEHKWYQNRGDKTERYLFAKTNFEVNTHISLFADLQYRYVRYVIQGHHEDFRDLKQKHVYNFFNPKGGIFCSVDEHNDLYFSVACSHREPSRDVYVEADAEQLQKVHPERLIDYELGYNLKCNKLNLNTNIFYMDYNDQLVLTGEINNLGAAIMTNVDKSFRLGFEASTNYQICKWLGLSGNVALSRNKIIDFTDYIEDWNNGGNHSTYLGTTDISFSPDLIAGLNVNFTPIKNLNISLQGQYVSRQYLDNTSCEARSLDPYLTTNASISYEWEQKVFKTLNFSLSVNNLLNRKYCTNGWVYRAWTAGSEYLEDGYFPQAGVNFMFGVTVGI